MERPPGNSSRGNGQDNGMRPRGTISTSVSQTNRQDDEWSMPLTAERREGTGRQQITQASSSVAPLLQKKGYSPIGAVKVLPKKELLSEYSQLGVWNQVKLQDKGNQLREKQEMLEKQDMFQKV